MDTKSIAESVKSAAESVKSNNLIKQNLPNIKYGMITIFFFSQIFFWSKIGSENALVSVSQQLLYSGIALTLFGLYLFKQRKAEMFNFGFNKVTLYFLIRIFAGGIGNTFSMIAVKNMRINSASTIFYAFPFLTNILSTFIFGEEYSLREFLKTVGCFVGVLCVTKPFSISAEDTPFGFFCAFMVLLMFSLTPLASKLLKGTDSSINLIGFGLSNIFIYYPITYFSGDTPLPYTFISITVLICFVLARVLGPYYFDLTYQNGNIVLLTPISFVILPWTLFYNIAFFRQGSDYLDFVGCFLILFINFFDVYLKLFYKKNKEENLVEA